MSEKNPKLHQQQGGIPAQDFAKQHGITLDALWKYIKAGKVVGARQNSLTKKWWIYPPAILLVKPRTCKRRKVSMDAPDVLAPTGKPPCVSSFDFAQARLAALASFGRGSCSSARDEEVNS